MTAMMIQVPPHCKHFAAALVEAVEVVARLAKVGRRAPDMLHAESGIATAIAKVECGAMADVLTSLDADGDEVIFDGKRWHSLGVMPTTYFTQAGPTTVERKLFRESGVHNGPTLDVVASRAGLVGDWTPAAAKAMAHLLQQGTGREAETTAHEVGRLPYSRSSFERVGHEVGRLYLGRRAEIDQRLTEAAAVPDGVRSVSVALDRVAVPMEELEIDGGEDGKDRLTRVWHMAHVGTVTLHDADGWAIATTRYACMPGGDIDELDGALQGDLVHLLTRRRGLRVVTLGDGAAEVRSRLDAIVDGVAKSAWDLLDYWHVAEKLALAAQAIAKGTSGKEIAARWKGWLLNLDDAPSRIREELSAHAGHKVVDDTLTYLDNHGHQMDYAAARREGLPIGSGNVEASCKSVVRMRMVRGGARWKHEPGDRVLHLRALAQSDRWNDGIAETLRPLKRTIRVAS